MRIVVGLSVLMVILLATMLQAEEEKETKISVSDCPKAVQKTLKREVGNGKLIDVDVRKIKGVAVYESEVWFGELEYDIVIRGDGTLLAKRLEKDGKDEDSDDADEDKDGDDEDGDDDRDGEDEEEVETPVKIDDLPRRVARTLKRESRGGEIEEIVKEQEGDKVVFEAEVEFETKKGEKEYEIEIGEDGTLVCKTLEEEEGKDAKAQGDDEEEDEDDVDEDDDD